MAKKKLFGNTKEPRCETCAHGKLSTNGDTVLCVRGGALPLHHSCRRYQYDPLRRIPRRRPSLSTYTEADFALDEQTAVVTTEKAKIIDDMIAEFTAAPAVEEDTTVQVDEAVEAVETLEDDVTEITEIENTEDVVTEDGNEETDELTGEDDTVTVKDNGAIEDEPIETDETDEAPASEKSALERSALSELMEYLTTNETPDTETILAILNKTPEPTTVTAADILAEAEAVAEAAVAHTPAASVSDLPDIDEDLANLHIDTVPDSAKAPLSDTPTDSFLLFADEHIAEATPITNERIKQAPLTADDLLFLPRGTRSDHEDAEDVGGGFMPLTGNE